MAGWIQSFGVIAAILVLAPLVAWGAWRLGSKAKGGGMLLGAMMFGLGTVLDPPSKHAVESVEPKKASPDNGEPPTP